MIDINKINSLEDIDFNKLTKDEIEKVTSALELKNKVLEQQERKANIEDVQERLNERKLTRANKQMSAEGKGLVLEQQWAEDKAKQARCNHLKGGQGAEGVVAGRGDDSQHAVIKHRMMNGDIWVRCLRCAKTWKHPIRRNYKTEPEYKKALEEYQTAVNFQTRNQTSGSYVFGWSVNDKGEGGPEYFRQATESTNLR